MVDNSISMVKVTKEIIKKLKLVAAARGNNETMGTLIGSLLDKELERLGREESNSVDLIKELDKYAELINTNSGMYAYYNLFAKTSNSKVMLMELLVKYVNLVYTKDCNSKVKLIWEDGYTREVDIIRYGIHGERHGEVRYIDAEWVNGKPDFNMLAMWSEDEMISAICNGAKSGVDLTKLGTKLRESD